MHDAEIPLPRLAGEIRRIAGRTPSYRQLHQFACNGAIPAEQHPTGRWFVYRRDLPQLVEALGLQPIGSAA